MDDKRYTLMNKNRPVLDFLYNLDTHHVVKILKRRELDFAPPAILDMKGNPTRAALDVWWLRRAIPASRAQIQRLIAELHVDSTLALAEKNFGLSLSDRYWINDPENPQNWDDINFFDNDFTEDLGLLTLGQDSSSDNPNLMSPNSTVGGDLDYLKRRAYAREERNRIREPRGLQRGHRHASAQASSDGHGLCSLFPSSRRKAHLLRVSEYAGRR